MRTGALWLCVGLVACTKAGPQQDSVEPPPAETKFAQPPEAKMPPPAPPAPPPATVAKVTVQMTAATLADDCPGAAPKAKAKSAVKADMADDSGRGARSRRACEQTSMQLSVTSTGGSAATAITVKKVELYDDKGKLIGELTPRAPTVWSKDGTYAAWDQQIAANTELAVSYALSEPPWGKVTERWNRTYVLKAVLTVGAGDQAVQRDVHVAAPTFLPPNVKT